LIVEPNVHEVSPASRVLEVSVQVGVAILLLAACFLIVRPFLIMIVWGIIIAVATYPGYERLSRAMGGRKTLAAVLCTALLLAIVLVPVALLSGTFVNGIQSAAAYLKDGNLTIPPPPPSVYQWPIIGVPLTNVWNQACNNLNAVLKMFAPQIKAGVTGLLSASAGIGITVIQFVLSIVLAGVILGYARAAAGVAHSLANRLFGDRGPELAELVTSTIRSVTTGILGVALIQTIFAGLGFLLVGLPAAGLWAGCFLIAAVLQVGVVALVPAVIYVFVTATSTKAVVFLIWCIIVAVMDNVLKPLLLGRGATVPIVVVFLGVIGGFMAMGIIGLFVGAIVLSAAYKWMLAWLSPPMAPDSPAS
jgi:predicted PurR-regulated permease PerM